MASRATFEGSFELLIDGELVPGAKQIEVVNPATGQLLARAPCADRVQLEAAVAAARRAYPLWSRESIAHRRGKLLELAIALEERTEAFARLLTQEQGKPLPQATREIRRSVALVRAFAGMNLSERVLKEGDAVRIIRQLTPLGVVAVITPWNVPMLLMIVKVAPAIFAGNTVVIKPAPTTPLTTLKFGELCAEVLPRGVVNIITDNNDLGDILTGHPDVAKIAFTGSTVTGRKVMARAASTLKRLTLELGGNDPAIVLDNVKPEEIAPKIFLGAMMNSGQTCLAIKRVYVPDFLYDEVCTELGRLAAAAVVGDGLQEGTQYGPLQNRAHFEKVLGQIEGARSSGRIIAGGPRLPGQGYFIRPTIVRDIPDDSRLVQEEQFGPVLPVLSYSSLDEAIDRANASEYGLGATVWSSDAELGWRVASRLEVGTVWVNKHMAMDPSIPFSGAKQSGHGTEMGQEGLEEYTQSRVINMAVGQL